MCGIAGIIYRDRSDGHPIGADMTRMLQSMKHRGPDSTGYALYGPAGRQVIMRYKLADANTPRDFEFEDRLRRHRAQVEGRLRQLGARNLEIEHENEYADRVTFDYDGDLKTLADTVEDVTDAEVLSLGHSLEII
jgi:glutamate synthase domain-containing protein 1